MELRGRIHRGLAVVVAAGLGAVLCGCQMPGQTSSNLIPETQSPDWVTLRATVKEYEAACNEQDARNLSIAQNTFNHLVELHSSDRIGDEALYYVGRIYYDQRAYQDARRVFLRHKEDYPNSEFAPTIAKLEAEMDRDLTAYREWVEEQRRTGGR